MASVSRVLLLESSLTASTTGSSLSLEPYSTDFMGWIAASSVNPATTVMAKIEHSADGSNWVDLVSFTALVGVSGAEAKNVTTAVLPYVRANVTLAGATQAATVLITLQHDKRK